MKFIKSTALALVLAASAGYTASSEEDLGKVFRSHVRGKAPTRVMPFVQGFLADNGFTTTADEKALKTALRSTKGDLEKFLKAISATHTAPTSSNSTEEEDARPAAEDAAHPSAPATDGAATEDDAEDSEDATRSTTPDAQPDDAEEEAAPTVSLQDQLQELLGLAKGYMAASETADATDISDDAYAANVRAAQEAGKAAAEAFAKAEDAGLLANVYTGLTNLDSTVAELEATRARLAASEEAQAALNKALADANIKASAYDAVLAELEKTKEALENATETSAKAADLEIKVADLEAKLATAATEAEEAAKAHTAALQAANEAATKAAEEAALKMRGFQTKLATANAKIAELEAAGTATPEELAAVQKEADQHKVAAQRFAQEKADVDAQLAALQAEIEAAKASIAGVVEDVTADSLDLANIANIVTDLAAERDGAIDDYEDILPQAEGFAAIKDLLTASGDDAALLAAIRQAVIDAETAGAQDAPAADSSDEDADTDGEEA